MKMDNLGARQMRSNNYSAHACEHCSNPLIVGLCRVYVSKQLFVVSICYCCLNSNVNTKLTNRDISFRFSFLFGLHFSSSVSTRCYPICAISSSFICFGDRYSLMCELIWVCCATATADSFHFLSHHLHHSCIAMALWLRLAGILSGMTGDEPQLYGKLSNGNFAAALSLSTNRFPPVCKCGSTARWVTAILSHHIDIRINTHKYTLTLAIIMLIFSVKYLTIRHYDRRNLIFHADFTIQIHFELWLKFTAASPPFLQQKQQLSMCVVRIAYNTSNPWNHRDRSKEKKNFSSTKLSFFNDYKLNRFQEFWQRK